MVEKFIRGATKVNFFLYFWTFSVYKKVTFWTLCFHIDSFMFHKYFGYFLTNSKCMRVCNIEVSCLNVNEHIWNAKLTCLRSCGTNLFCPLAVTLAINCCKGVSGRTSCSISASAKILHIVYKIAYFQNQKEYYQNHQMDNHKTISPKLYQKRWN